jgi:hypothetical protein
MPRLAGDIGLTYLSMSDPDTAVPHIHAQLAEVAACWDTTLTHANREP